MDLNLKNRVALVTGSSQGIGKGIATVLAHEGVKIAITSNDASNLETASAEIQKFGGDVIAVKGDAASEQDVSSIIEKVMQHFGKIDILINNVGKIGSIQNFEEISSEEWDALFKLNVMSGVNFSKYVLPQMKKNEWGRIIFIASEKSIEPGVNMSQYAMTKAAIVSISKSLANEVGKHGITVNCISPGIISTPSWDKDAEASNLTREEFITQFSRSVLNKRFGQPKDVGALIGFLCSSSADWITGGNFRIDGGAIQSL